MENILRTGGQILVDQLLKQGIDKVFCVPGESFLNVIDALYSKKEQIKLYNARHEAAASHMAEAYGKLQKKPGVAIVSRGPGACHASVGVHVALQDSTPLILIVGQVPQRFIDRESFQEIDYRIMFQNIAKKVFQIDKVDRIPEYFSQAFRLSISGKPGPVVISIPENILEERAKVKDVKKIKPLKIIPDYSKINIIINKLNKSKRPILIVGGSDWTKDSSKNLLKFATRNNIPVVSGFRRQDIIENNSDVFVGSLGTSVSTKLLENIRKSDLLIIFGSRLGEMTSNRYNLLEGRKKYIIHVYPDGAELDRIFFSDLPLSCSIYEGSIFFKKIKINNKKEKILWLKNLKKEYIDDTLPINSKKDINLSKIFNLISNHIKEDKIITLDAGNHTGWPQRFITYGNHTKQLGSTCGCMGYSIPAAISASLQFPEKKVICVVGDGGFMMSGMEIMTAIQYKLSLIVIILNNNSFGTIRMHQEIKFPKRKFATDIENPDFVKLAKSMGAYGKKITKTKDFLNFLKSNQSSNKVYVVEITSDLEEITSRKKISEL